MKKPGRPPSAFKTQIEPIAKIEGRDDEPQPHEIDDALDTLQRAQKIQMDPKMMGHVHEATGKKIRSLKSLKALANRKALAEG